MNVRYRNGLIASSLAFVLAYLAVAFVWLDLNCYHWNPRARVTVVYFGALLAIFMGGITAAFTDEPAA